MSGLETQLRRLAANGELTYLSLIPVAGKGVGGVVFDATVSPASKFGHSHGRDADPVAAILKAIEGLPKSYAKEKSKRSLMGLGSEMPKRLEPWDLV